MKTAAPGLIAIIFFLLLISPALSQEYDYGRSGAYVGVNIVGGFYTRFEDELEDQLSAIGYVVSVDMDDGVGFGVYGGYRVHPHFAVEVEFEMLPDVDVGIDGLGDFFEIETWTLTANGKVFLLTGRTQPYLLAGLGVMEVDAEDTVGVGVSVTDSDFALRFGAGLEFYVTESVVGSAGIDYVLPTGDVEYLDYVSIGVGIQYRF